MFLLYLLSRIVSSFIAFFYPGYASFKTLSRRPASEEDLERWLMYWSVLGCIVGVEYVAEWVISWIPFYYALKTLFLLYLVLPQTRGSTYLYLVHLQPFLSHHEFQIDATLASLKARALAFIQERLRALWEQVSASMGQPQRASFNPVTELQPGAIPTASDPVSGPAQLVSSLWRSYGPVVVAAGAAIVRQSAASASQAAAHAQSRARELNAQAAAQASPSSPNAPQMPTYARSSTTQSILERRRQLEAELAALASMDPAAGVPTSPGPKSPAYLSSRGSSSSDLNTHLRERTSSSAGRFEEIDRSDTEGYISEQGLDETGYDMRSSARRPAAVSRGSWFGNWTGGGSGNKNGYERVKSD